VSILQKSRVQLHVPLEQYRLRENPVSILQKSRVQLHNDFRNLYDRNLLCQSFRNQGFSYTTPSPTLGIELSSVNPSEIKGSVTRVGSFSRDLVADLCQSFRNQGFSYTLFRSARSWSSTLCQSFRNQGFSYTISPLLVEGLNLLCQSFRNQGFSYTR